MDLQPGPQRVLGHWVGRQFEGWRPGSCKSFNLSRQRERAGEVRALRDTGSIEMVIRFALLLLPVLAAPAGAADALGAGQAAGRITVEHCKAFEAEKAQLDATGMAEDVERGPEWGQANLSKERLASVRRYIFLEEHLTFLCPDLVMAAAVRKLEEQARLQAAAALERQRMWDERMKAIPPPERGPVTKVARAPPTGADGVPPLPERKSR